jgi:hypothetical protein
MWTLGAELSCSDRGLSFAGKVVLSGAGEDAGAGEVVWLAGGMSGVAVAASFSMLGLALELEACSGARGALKVRKHQVSSQGERYVGNNIKKRNLPRGNRSWFLRVGRPNLLPFLCRLSLGPNPAFPADAYTGRGRSLV